MTAISGTREVALRSFMTAISLASLSEECGCMRHITFLEPF